MQLKAKAKTLIKVLVSSLSYTLISISTDYVHIFI